MIWDRDPTWETAYDPEHLLATMVNYQLSRARRVLEDAFGILANRFRLFHCTVHFCKESMEDLLYAGSILQHFLREHEGAILGRTRGTHGQHPLRSVAFGAVLLPYHSGRVPRHGKELSPWTTPIFAQWDKIQLDLLRD
jgi:hypothetical protein